MLVAVDDDWVSKGEDWQVKDGIEVHSAVTKLTSPSPELAAAAAVEAARAVVLVILKLWDEDILDTWLVYKSLDLLEVIILACVVVESVILDGKIVLDTVLVVVGIDVGVVKGVGVVVVVAVEVVVFVLSTTILLEFIWSIFLSKFPLSMVSTGTDVNEVSLDGSPWDDVLLLLDDSTYRTLIAWGILIGDGWCVVIDAGAGGCLIKLQWLSWPAVEPVTVATVVPSDFKWCSSFISPVVNELEIGSDSLSGWTIDVDSSRQQLLHY